MSSPAHLDSRFPLLRYADKIVVVAPRLFPGLDFYAKTGEYRSIAVDWNARYDKRDKSARRYRIGDVNGALDLTVPIRKPESITTATWNDILISSHGDWQSVHQTALESAYGRTPYFEFYIDSFRPLFVREWNDRPLRQYIERSHSILTSLLPLPPLVESGVDKSCEIRLPKGDNISGIESVPYWQPRADRLGFIPSLSILDALFSLGPALILQIISDKSGECSLTLQE